MNGEQIGGVVRHVLTFAGGWLVTKGYVDEQTMQSAVGAVVTLIGLGWSYFVKK